MSDCDKTKGNKMKYVNIEKIEKILVKQSTQTIIDGIVEMVIYDGDFKDVAKEILEQFAPCEIERLDSKNHKYNYSKTILKDELDAMKFNSKSAKNKGEYESIIQDIEDAIKAIESVQCAVSATTNHRENNIKGE